MSFPPGPSRSSSPTSRARPGCWTSSVRQLEDALATAASGGVPDSYTAAAELTLGRLDTSMGDLDGARQHLEISLALAHGVGDTWAAEHAAQALTRLEHIT